MIDVKEHFYDDDPKRGHPDVRTVLKDVSYFFLGNGFIQAAVQIAPSGEGTPVGLLIMNPEYLGKKRESLTMDNRSGLEETMIRIFCDHKIYRPLPGALEARWSEEYEIPAVFVRWRNDIFQVEENFYCPTKREPFIIREVRVKNLKRQKQAVNLRTGLHKKTLDKKISFNPGEEKKYYLQYRLDSKSKSVILNILAEQKISKDALNYWEKLAKISFGSPLLDHYFRASKFQLPAVIAHSGRVDGSIWQYNREWLRDQSMLALALTLIGEFDLSRRMFSRLFERFVTEEGDTIDSSEKRHPDEVELDQNGFLLHNFKNYVLWTGDFEMIQKYWEKIFVTAEFPLKEIFRHKPSGLLANMREFWERHRVHGIEKGIELAHQLYTSLGLSSAAILARLISRREQAWRWEEEAIRVKKAMLEDKKFRLIDSRGFIKRRALDGKVQETICALPEAELPRQVPLVSKGKHFLNPDTSTALPLALGFISPRSQLASLTLATLEALWNQAWKGGGYGRYHSSSEPDSPGAWPFPSLFVARACLETENFKNVWRILRWLNTVPGALAGSWFEFYGKRLAPPFPQVGIVPWNWAEMLILFIHHIIGIQVEENGLRIRPKLFAGLNEVEACFPFRRGKIELKLYRTKKGKPRGFRTNGTITHSTNKDIILSYPKDDLWVEANL